MNESKIKHLEFLQNCISRRRHYYRTNKNKIERT